MVPLLNTIVIVLLIIRTVGVLSKNLSESERVLRAAFVQKLVGHANRFEGRVKLVGGPSQYEGNVYIYHAGRWGAVCDDGWNNAAAHVACQIFNKTGVATGGGQYGVATEKYWMDNIDCRGDEQSLSQCPFEGWGYSDCHAHEIAGAICVNETKISKTSLKTKRENPIYLDLDLTNATLRLAGGRFNNEGRVEIFIHGFWGSICADGWTLYEAATVCRYLSLGYAAEATQTDQFGSSRIVLGGVHCVGDEENMFLCNYEDYGDVTCRGDIGYVAGVVCTHYLADLVISTSAIERSAHLQDVMMFQLECAMEEKCLTKSAYDLKNTYVNWQFETRRLLRFTASSFNAGTADFRPYLPKHLWQWHLCHMHYHSMEVFATFDIINRAGKRVAEGHKASFCLEDNTCSGGMKKYSCKNYGDQGISVNCSDVYYLTLDCQWVDVSDLEPGDYRLKVAINPFLRIAEQSFFNNAAYCQLRLAETYALVYECQLGRL